MIKLVIIIGLIDDVLGHWSGRVEGQEVKKDSPEKSHHPCTLLSKTHTIIYKEIRKRVKYYQST